jgi:predicted  nucleic acid-binding Zn-ribbon protein
VADGNLEHTQALLDCQAEYLRHAEWLVGHELREQLPGFEQAVTDATAALEKADADLAEPLKALQWLDGEIARVEGRCTQFQAKITDERAETRIEAQRNLADWGRELDLLRTEREHLDKQTQPIRDAKDKAAADLAKAHAELETYRLNLAVPLFERGQSTDAYRAWILESGLFVQVLLKGEPADFRWASAWQFMNVLALRSGWRSDQLAKDAERIRRALRDQDESEQLTTEEYSAARAESRPAVPSMADVKNLELARAANVLSDLNPAGRSHVEDLRGPAAPRSARTLLPQEKS